MFDTPKAILIDNSSYCNLRCSMCDYINLSKHRKKQVMSFDLYKKIINEISELDKNIRIWEIFIGDPCCCPDMGKRIAYAKSCGLTDVVLNSNGNSLFESRSKEFITSGLDIMYIGIDALSQEAYSKIRVGGRLDKAIKNTLTYRDLLAKYGNGKQSLFVQFVECDINYNEKDAFVAFWKKEGVNVKLRVRGSWGGIIPAPNLDSTLTRKPCKWANETMVICADGSVALCAVDAHCLVNCGNSNYTSIKELWKGKLGLYRSFHNSGTFDLLPDFCKNCLDWQTTIGEYK